ncbi:MAG: hypothetical protein DI598_11360 [Pseudopedobacter saltans]|uniref:HTH cro/C1-type domain-containing protein n=1 Tax=Pseudopedobacter saltans TaxID=151895 RepID=A0A2W5EXD0_9SPHI|nr:MAG: hypothetical protein DI598_11360 [Pseudopedobacter saltans]
MAIDNQYDTYKIILGNQLHKIRKYLNLSQNAFKESVGIWQNRISEIENAKGNIEFETIIKIAYTLKISTIWLWKPNESIENLQSIPRRKSLDKYVQEEKVKFGKRLDQIVRDRNITQETLSVLTGIQSADITNYIKGNHNITLYNMVRISDNLKIMVKDFFDYNAAMPGKGSFNETIPRKRKPKNNL